MVITMAAVIGEDIMDAGIIGMEAIALITMVHHIITTHPDTITIITMIPITMMEEADSILGSASKRCALSEGMPLVGYSPFF